MPIDASIPGRAVQAGAGGQNPLANLGQLLQVSGGIQAQQREGQTRELLGDPGSYTEGGSMSAADLRPEALVSLRGIDPKLSLGIEQFAQKQKVEERAMSTWERETKAKEADQAAKWWGLLESHGVAVRQAYDDALGGADPSDAGVAFKARAAAQMAYESRKDAVQDVAKAMGFELPAFFKPDEFTPEAFNQFRLARQAKEREAYLLRVPAEEPGGAPQDVVFAGTPEELAAEAKRTGATAVGDLKTGFAGQAAKPHSDLGKLTADFRSGLLGETPAENTANYQKALAQQKLGNLDAKALAKLTEEQGDNYVTASKDYLAVRDSFGRINASADGTPAGDLALIFNYMKMLDPGSTVREGEFASAAASGSYGERFQAAAQNILQGTRLSAEQRTDFQAQARKLMRSMQKTQELTRDNYVRIAKRSGADDESVADRVVLLELKAEEAAKVPAPREAGAAGGAVQPLPPAVRNVPGLQRSKVSGNYRNPATGEEWDAQGNPIARPGG